MLCVLGDLLGSVLFGGGVCGGLSVQRSLGDAPGESAAGARNQTNSSYIMGSK